jgi:hypothetical protein
LPLLCPFLSKHELDAAGAPTTNGIDAFHGPLTGWTLTNTINTQVLGHLSKQDQDISDTWDIDLHAPCFAGQCAQDNVIPVAYQPDSSLDGKIFGCDLWVEVTGISLPNKTGTLIVIKHVVNDNGGQANAVNFTMNVNGVIAVPQSFPGAESPGTTVTVAPGSYTVTETGPGGYAQSNSADCSGTIAAGETKTCTVTNDDEVRTGTITVVKVVENNGVGTKTAVDFQMTIDDGSVNQNQAYSYPVGTHTVSEASDLGYVKTYSTECPAGVVNVVASQNVTCTVTNTYPAAKITVQKVVINHIDGTTTLAADFQMKIDGNNVLQNTKNPVGVGAHTISETGPSGYTTSFSGACNGTDQVTVANGGDVTCTVTNEQQYGTITVIKVVNNTLGGDDVPSSFSLFVHAVSGNVSVTNGVAKNFAPGSYDATEGGHAGYSATFSGDCSSSGHIILAASDNKTCTITNHDQVPHITLIKNVVGGTASADDFSLTIDGNFTANNSQTAVTSNSPHVINEGSQPGYTFTTMTGTGDRGAICPATPGGSVILQEGENITCTITNTHQ